MDKNNLKKGLINFSSKPWFAFFLGFIFGTGILSIIISPLTISSYNILPSGNFSLTLVPSLKWGIGLLLTTTLLTYITNKFQNVSEKYILSGFTGVSFSFLLLSLSSLGRLKFGFIPDPSYVTISIQLLIAAMFFQYFFDLKSITAITTIGIMLLCLTFLFSTHGNTVFTDDHPSVLYRLQLLKQHFPDVPLYNTAWNAGIEWRDFFATGILNIFFIFYPLIKLTNIENAYPVIIFSILFIITPLSTYAASRLLYLSRSSSLISAFLVLTANASWYKWSLSYGSMGFVCSTALFPLALALIIRTLSDKNKTSYAILTSLVIVTTLTLFWSAQGLSLIPLIIIGLLNAKKLLTSKRILLTIFSLLIINLPWMALFINVSKVGAFVQLESSAEEQSIKSINEEKSSLLNTAMVKGKKEKITKENFLRALRENTLKINPLLLILTIPSIFLINWRRKIKIYFSVISIWLFFLATVVSNLKPQLELDRMMVILSLILCIPVANAITQVFKHKNLKSAFPDLTLYAGKASIISMLILSFLSTTAIFQNRSWEKYKLFNSNFYTLAESIDKHSETGRTLFAGFILHEFGGSHIAPLAHFSNSPIMASSPVHNLWQYTDVIPESYRKKGPAGIEEYLDIYNVSLVIAHERPWKNYFRNSSFRYEEVEIIDKLVLFKRDNFPDSYFMEGNGKIISQDASGITLSLKSKDAILRFNYLPFLKVSNCEKIIPYKMNGDINLIKIENCRKNTPIIIQSVSPIKRILQ